MKLSTLQWLLPPLFASYKLTETSVHILYVFGSYMKVFLLPLISKFLWERKPCVSLTFLTVPAQCLSWPFKVYYHQGYTLRMIFN
jgi:hypothetical protein